MTVLAILQPGYLPWLGFFDQVWRSDVFIYYDDVQFDKHGWRNRNRIKSPHGPLWLTVPVLNSGRHGQKICDVEIDNRQPWARKHIASTAQNYARAHYLSHYLPQLEELLCQRWESLVELDIAVAGMLCDWFNIKRTIWRASTLSISGEQSTRLLNFCRHFGADRYLTGDSAQAYLDVGLFESQGVQVEWQSYQHPVYPQLHGEFMPYLSALDLLFNAGPQGERILKGET